MFFRMDRKDFSMFSYKDYICAIWNERSFSRASQKLFVSQPWLSSVVKKTEQEIGTPIFDRSTNPISLTEAGRYYLEQAKRITEIEDETRMYFSSLSAKNGASVRVGSSMFFCTYVLPGLMDEFKAMYPQVELTFVEGITKDLTDKLLDHTIDFSLEVEKIQHPKIESIEWASEEIILAVPAAFPINQELAAYRYDFEEYQKRKTSAVSKPPISLSLFHKEKFLLLDKDNDIYRRALNMCRHAGFVPDAALSLSQMMTAYYLVCEGQGVAFLRSTIPEHVSPTDKVVFYRIDDKDAVRSIYLSRLTTQPNPFVQKLLDFILEHGLHSETN